MNSSLFNADELATPDIKIPAIVRARYELRTQGYAREISRIQPNGVAFTTETTEGGLVELLPKEYEAMKQLVSAVAIKAWEDMRAIVGDAPLATIFDALWIASRDWESLRKTGGKTRTTTVKKLAGEIAKAVSTLLDQIEQLDSLLPADHIGHRNPDYGPCSEYQKDVLLAVRDQHLRLSGTIPLGGEDGETLHPLMIGISSDDVTNFAVGQRSTGSEYARSLIYLLRQEGVLPNNQRGFLTCLLELAGLVNQNIDLNSIIRSIESP